MLVVGAVALTALAGPWVWRAWSETHLTDGKVQAFADSSSRSSVDLAMCLLKRRPSGLALEISSENHYVDAARGVVVELSAAGGRRAVTAWAPKGTRLQVGEIAHLDSCLVG